MKRKGFTLIELVMVIVIIGILAAIAIPRFVGLRDEARDAACAGNKGGLRAAVAHYYAIAAIVECSAASLYPVSLATLAVTAGRDCTRGRLADDIFIGAIPTCPTTAVAYTYIRANGTVTCATTGHEE